MPFHYYTIKDGLPSNQIHMLCQDSQGYIWIATNNGISKYDGVTFTKYSTPNGLPNPDVTKIQEDISNPGALYVTTSMGMLYRFQNEKFKLAPYNVPLDNGVDDVCSDNEGTVWCITRTGLYKLINGNAYQVTLPFRFKVYDVKRCLRAEQNGLWISDGKDLHFFQPTRGSLPSFSDSVSFPANVYWLSPMIQGNIYVTLTDNTIYEVHTGRIISNRKFDLYPGVFFYDNDIKGYCLSSHNGFLTLSGDDFGTAPLRTYSRINGLPDIIVTCLLLDHENNIWIGTWSGGIARLTDKGIVHLPIQDNLSRRSAAVRQNGSLWVQVANGIEQISPQPDNNWKLTLHNSVKPGNLMFFDPDGNLWVTAFGDDDAMPVLVYSVTKRGDTFAFRLSRTIDITIDKNKRAINAIMLDRHQRAWLSISPYGMIVYDLTSNKILKTYFPEDGLPGNSVRIIYEDRNGKIWFGGFDNGLSEIDDLSGLPATMKNYSMKDGLPDDRIRSIYQDARGRLWIGTRFGGVAIYQNDHFDVLSEKDGLHSSSVWTMTEDNQNKMWLGSEIGLDCVDEKTGIVLDMNDELLSSHIYYCGMMANNNLWFVTAKEIVIDNLRLERPDTIAPPVSIRNFLVAGMEQNVSGSLKFPYGQNRCTIEYIGMCFSDPEEVRYQSMLEGLDKGWTRLTTQRAITYASLQPGTYTFHVRAISPGGMPSTQPAVLRFTILPPYWATWWFRSLILICVITTGPLIYFGRISRLKNEKRAQESFSLQLIESQEHERKRIAQELHDSIGQDLILIKNQAELGRSAVTDPKILQKFDDISSTATGAIKESRAISYNLRPYQLDNLGLTQAIRSMISKVADSTVIEFISDINTVDGYLKKEEEIHFFRVVQESMNNIIKHSGAISATVLILVSNQTIQLRITDNGKGFYISGTPSMSRSGSVGLGLKGIEERVKILGGTLSIKSAPREGTTILIHIPIIQSAL